MASAVHTPLTIYVLYHQDSDEARALAHGLHDWFRLKTDDGERSESGLPIWFRCRVGVARRAKGDHTKVRIDPGIHWDEADLNVVVVLADRHMVADKQWRHALESLCDEDLQRRELRGKGRILLLPVEVHRSLHQLPYVTAERNPLRIGEPLPARLSKEVDSGGFARHVERRLRILRRAVTESVTRELRWKPGQRGAPERLAVFLSHAKRDGRDIAEALRDGFAAYGQLRVWYDANDLPAGYAWGGPMRKAARNLSALVSVVTDAYPSRPWCREEVREARTPRRLRTRRRGAGVDLVSAWEVRPVVAVHRAGAGWSRAMAPLVHVPAIGWESDDEPRAERIADIADRLVLEMLVANFYQRIAEHLRSGRGDLVESIDAKTHVALLTWVPEPWSAVRVIDELLHGKAPQLSPQIERVLIAYPGHGLRPVEEYELQAVLDGVARIHGESRGSRRRARRLRIGLVSQERLLDRLKLPLDQEDPPIPPQGSETKKARRKDREPRFPVALSGGGKDLDLEGAGIGGPHLDDLFLRLARRLLADGCSLVFGGAIADLDRNLTESLIEAARTWMRDGGARSTTGDHDGEVRAADLDDVPFINHTPWPISQNVGLEHHADLVGMCRFEEVLPRADQKREDLPLGRFGIDSWEGRDLMARALSRMREETAKDDVAKARILVGGRLASFSGWLPGIVEEGARSIEKKQVPILLGAYGGSAALLANWLRGKTRAWPAPLTFDACTKNGRLAKLLADAPEDRREGLSDEVRAAYGSVEAEFRKYRDILQEARATEGPVFGVPGIAADLWQLLDARSPTVIADLVLRVVRAVRRKWPVRRRR